MRILKVTLAYVSQLPFLIFLLCGSIFLRQYLPHFNDNLVGYLFFSFVLYLIAFSNTLLSMKGEELNEKHLYYQITKEYCEKANIDMVKVLYDASKHYNASAFFDTITIGYFGEDAEEDVIRGIIAHELGHIKNKDYLLLYPAQKILGTISFFFHYLTCYLFQNNTKDLAGRKMPLKEKLKSIPFTFFICGIFFPEFHLLEAVLPCLFFGLCGAYYIQHKEYMCDSFAARLDERAKKGLIKLFTSIDKKRAGNTFFRFFQIIRNIFGSHPIAHARVLNIKSKMVFSGVRIFKATSCFISFFTLAYHIFGGVMFENTKKKANEAYNGVVETIEIYKANNGPVLPFTNYHVPTGN